MKWSSHPVDDAGHFLDTWAAEPAACGWGPLEVFGCDRNRPWQRLDKMGLAWFIGGGRIVATKVAIVGIPPSYTLESNFDRTREQWGPRLIPQVYYARARTGAKLDLVAAFYLAVQIQAFPSRLTLKNLLAGRGRSADTGATARWHFTGNIRGDETSLGTTAAVPWHYTTLVDFVDHWQTLIAGLIALIAAIITVVVTLKVERRKVDRELDALRKSLAIELRQLIPRALGVHGSLTKLSANTDGLITARMLESLSRMPAPIVYPANKIGLLEKDAMDVVIVYGLLDIARDGVARLITTYRTPDDISPKVVVKTAEAFLEACKYARSVLPKLRTGVATHDDRDILLITAINETAAAAEQSREQKAAP
jgi:hypothetical protein